jgi:hypothetical protein
MRLLALALVAATLAVEPVRADVMLYATRTFRDRAEGATPEMNRVDGFCLRGDGSLEPSPTVSVQTGDDLPRRLLVGRDEVGPLLFVAESDKVEQFSIGNAGGLVRLAGLGRREGFGQLNPQDLALSPDGHTLYVTDSGAERIEAYRLVPTLADGAPCTIGTDEGCRRRPEEDPSSCVRALPSTRYNGLLVLGEGNLLYASFDGRGGRPDGVEVHRINPDGSLLTPASTCFEEAPEGADTLTYVAQVTTPWVSRRVKLFRPRPMSLVTIDGSENLYVVQQSESRIRAFAMVGHLFSPPNPYPDVSNIPPPPSEGGTKEDQRARERFRRDLFGQRKYKKGEQAQALKPKSNGRGYRFGTVVVGPEGATLFGAQFFSGRVDAYPLDSGGLKRSRPRSTEGDPKASPVGLVKHPDLPVLYVAGGFLDRVVAFRLDGATGMLRDTEPFSRTDEMTDSFPNDVAVAVLAGNCR